jgi:NAD-dependent dihydropyrimidine dehydrogenase PreA subunit
MERMLYLKDVVTLSLNEEKCIGCGMCIDVCPHAVIGMNGSNRAWIQDRDACMECGACSLNCLAEAVSVQAGVGCAAAVINSMLGRDPSSCCCTIEPCEQPENQKKTSCC